MSRKGFTLIELLVVIAIISILSSVVLASLNAARARGTLSASKLQNSNIFHALGDSALLQLDFDDCAGNVATDLSGNGNNATFSVAPTWPTTTYSGTGCALGLNGSTQSGLVSNSISFSPQNFALSLWFKTTGGGDVKIFSMNATSHPLQTFGSTLRSCINGLCVLGTTSIIDNAWHFVAVVGNTSNVQVYLDGKSTPEISSAPSGTTVTGTPLIGSSWPSGGFFPGSLDELRLYSRNLTSMEIRDMYLAGAAAHGIQLADLK